MLEEEPGVAGFWAQAESRTAAARVARGMVNRMAVRRKDGCMEESGNRGVYLAADAAMPPEPIFSAAAR